MDAVAPEAAAVDAMSLCQKRHVDVHGSGFVELLDVLPSKVCATGDEAIARAARVSTKRSTADTTEAKDRCLINFLYRHKHTSPFEMAEVQFAVKAPIFVARQWMRHRTGSYSEWSARYATVTNEFYRPVQALRQSTSNRQGSGAELHNAGAELFQEYLDASESLATPYSQLVEEHGMAREQARIGLPVSVYTQFYWKTNLHNLMHFLRLRMAPDAQQEIRDYAHAIYEIVRPIFPATFEAFRIYTLDAITLSALDVQALSVYNTTSDWNAALAVFKNAREKSEFIEKAIAIKAHPVDAAHVGHGSTGQ